MASNVYTKPSTPANWLNTLYPNAPTNPGYIGVNDPKNPNALLPAYQLHPQDSIMPGFQSMLDASKLDPTALNALTSQATSTAPSAWAQVARASNTANTANQMGAAGAQNNAGQASAYSGLASHGGLRQGAAQNIATQGAKSLLGAKQGVMNQSNLNDLGILSQDATNKMGMLSQAVTGAQGAAQLGQGAANSWANVAQGQQQYNTGVDQANINTLLQNNQGQNLFNSNQTNANLSAWAANQQAKATENAHTLWITGLINKVIPWKPEQLKTLRRLKYFGLRYFPEATIKYVKEGFSVGGLKQKMLDSEFDFTSLRPFILRVIKLIDDGKGKEAVELYITEVNALYSAFGVRHDYNIEALYAV